MTSPSFLIFKQLKIGNDSVRLFFENEVPFVEHQGLSYNHIWAFALHLPILSHLQYVREFAEISNFLWKGKNFCFIEKIHDYQKFYKDQIELELNFPGDVFLYRLTDYQIFDVDVMHDPLVKEGHLNYFVYEAATGVPYKVVVPFPYTSNAAIVHYQILPVL